MGVWGWEELRDGVTLQGFVSGDASVDEDDGDWNIDVTPARGFRYLLSNTYGNSNQNGLITCEVEPAQHLKDHGVDVRDPQAAEQHLGDKQRRWVTITGTWAIDKSHAVDRSTILAVGDSVRGKTEIHPVASVLVEHPAAADNSFRLIEFLVLSDDSTDRSETPPPTPLFPIGTSLANPAPHAGESRSAGFDMPIALEPKHQILQQVNASNSGTFTLVGSSRFQTLQCRVESGTPEDGKGFFFAQIRLPGFTLLTYLLSRGCDPSAGIRELMSRAAIPSVRKLFDRLDAATLQPLACPALLTQMSVFRAKIASVADAMKSQPGPVRKPKQDPVLQEFEKEMDALQKQLDALDSEARAHGCYFGVAAE